MEQDILEKFEAQEKKIDEIQKSIQGIKRYFLWMFILKMLLIVIPLIALAFAIPWLLNIYSSTYGSLLK